MSPYSKILEMLNEMDDEEFNKLHRLQKAGKIDMPIMWDIYSCKTRELAMQFCRDKINTYMLNSEFSIKRSEQ